MRIFGEDQLKKELALGQGLPLLSENYDDGQWDEPPPPHENFQTILFCMVQTCDELRAKELFWEPTLSKEDTLRQAHVGLFRQKIGRGEVILNWTPEWKNDGPVWLPPHHMVIRWDDTTCGVLGPFAHRRLCWSCRQVAEVDLPCDSCGNREWFALIIRQENVVEWMTEAVSRVTGDDQLYEDTGGRKAELRASEKSA